MLLVSGVAWLALRHHPLDLMTPVDQQQADRRPQPDAVSGLPAGYGQVPRLGPPLPGDLGRPILERRQQLTSQSGAAVQTPEQQRAEADRQRIAQQVIQAREAGVMIQASVRAAPTPDIGQGSAPALSAPTPSTERLALDSQHDPNDQQRKLDFVGRTGADTIYNGHALQTPASPYEVIAGTVIAASLITGLDSDLPGSVIAQVTENVFDTATGQILLIPQGSRLIGRYDSVVAFEQKRALLVWQRMILPDGSSISLDNMPAADPAGYAGLEDKVDFHSWQLLKGVAISTLLGVGSDLQFSGNGGLVEAIRQSGTQNVSRAGDQLTAKSLDIQPTLTIRPGAPVRMLVDRDLILAPWKGDR